MKRYDMSVRKTAKVPFFAGLDRAELERLGAECTEHGFDPGETIRAWGAPLGTYRVLLQGRWRIEDPDGTERTVSERDVAWIGPDGGGAAPEAGAVRAETRCYVLDVPGATMRRLVETVPGIGERVR